MGMETAVLADSFLHLQHAGAHVCLASPHLEVILTPIEREKIFSSDKNSSTSFFLLHFKTCISFNVVELKGENCCVKV